MNHRVTTTPLPLGEKITRTVRQERRRDAERRNFLSFTGNRVSIWAKINAQSYLKMATGGSPQGLVPGIVGAVVAALAGAVSSFVAYQKRRLCFRESGPAPV
ncbi:CD99 antigen [Cricetulus griseus]|uniref:CD99 antigen n=1 Tax=Cricetulus griseus TaxID=10029 RepID=G3IMF5_CRIGR|nr:CD99 antigen [Cricetulus griseus]